MTQIFKGKLFRRELLQILFKGEVWKVCYYYNSMYHTKKCNQVALQLEQKTELV